MTVRSLADALTEARAFAGQRGWQVPSEATTLEAEKLLDLVRAPWPAPEVQSQADGSISVEWEDAARGWLTLTVKGQQKLEHAAVINGDEYGLAEDFVDALPGWAHELLNRLHLLHPTPAPPAQRQ